MKFLRVPLLGILGAILFAASGCTETRIRSNPEGFARATAAQQAHIAAGVVDVGFDRDMVRMAAGEPERISVLTDSKGTTEVWRYDSPVKTAPNASPATVPGQVSTRLGHIHHHLIVTFDQSGKVVSLEH